MFPVLSHLEALDPLSVFWLLSSVAISCTHIIFNCNVNFNLEFVKHITDSLKPFYYFGKLKPATLKDEANPKYSPKLVSNISSIPKSCFRHFYAVGLAVHSLVFASVVLHLTSHTHLPDILQQIPSFIHWYRPGSRDEPRNPWPVFIVLACMELQLMRRAYECFVVSSFSKGTMSVVHYFYGMFFYLSFGIGVLVSIPLNTLSFSVGQTTSGMLASSLGVAGFLLGSYFQNQVMYAFANLRQKEKDTSARGHYLPRGGLFEYVSSPHYLCEILIYLSLCTVVQWQSVYLVCAAVFVVTNQVSAALTVHNWYMQTFPNYPKHRKALVPYLF